MNKPNNRIPWSMADWPLVCGIADRHTEHALSRLREYGVLKELSKVQVGWIKLAIGDAFSQGFDLGNRGKTETQGD